MMYLLFLLVAMLILVIGVPSALYFLAVVLKVILNLTNTLLRKLEEKLKELDNE